MGTFFGIMKKPKGGINYCKDPSGLQTNFAQYASCRENRTLVTTQNKRQLKLMCQIEKCGPWGLRERERNKTGSEVLFQTAVVFGHCTVGVRLTIVLFAGWELGTRLSQYRVETCWQCYGCICCHLPWSSSRHMEHQVITYCYYTY